MAITKMQQKLDLRKWYKSEKLGTDACGTFDYCAKCDKEKENPCGKAYSAFHSKSAKKKVVVK